MTQFNIEAREILSRLVNDAALIESGEFPGDIAGALDIETAAKALNQLHIKGKIEELYNAYDPSGMNARVLREITARIAELNKQLEETNE